MVCEDLQLKELPKNQHCVKACPRQATQSMIGLQERVFNTTSFRFILIDSCYRPDQFGCPILDDVIALIGIGDSDSFLKFAVVSLGAGWLLPLRILTPYGKG